jgi:multiple sugar transport system permease protein
VRILRRIGLYVGLSLAALTFIYPFIWMASSTFKPREEFGTLAIIPDHFTLDNYRTMWARAPFGRALLNSTMVATTITVAVLVFGSITAYAMARLSFRGRPALNAATLAVLLVPGQLTLIPLYTLIVQLGWIDTYTALIVPYLFNATAILMLRQFFLQIPQSLIDAARMDGMSEMRILFTIVWPLSKPVLSIVAIFTFMGAWNEVLWPLLVVREQNLMTLPQLLTVFALGGGAGSVGVSLASAMVLVVPVVVAYAFLQRNFIESMAGSGIKG